MKRLLLTLGLGLALLSASADETVKMTKEVLMDKIKGGWAGQTIGC